MLLLCSVVVPFCVKGQWPMAENLQPRCEVKKNKRNFLMDTTFHDAVNSPCIFQDVTCLSQETRKCAVHERACVIPKVDFLIAGTSCTGGSKLNTKWQELRTAMVEKRKDIQTVSTFLGFVEVLGLSEAKLGILENVTSLGDLDSLGGSTKGGEDNLSEFIRILDEAGWKSKVTVVRSDDYYLPQRRQRLYIFLAQAAWLVETGQDETEFFGNVEQFLLAMAAPGKAEPVHRFLEVPTSRFVIEELQRLQDMKAEAEENGKTTRNSTKWAREHMDFCEKRNMRWPPDTPEYLETNPWFKVLCL